MRIKFRLRFPFGETIYKKNGKWLSFNFEDVFHSLSNFTEVKSFECQFDVGVLAWVVEAEITPMPSYSFIQNLTESIASLYNRSDAIIDVYEIKLSKKEMNKYRTALMMEKIKGGKET